MFVKKRLSGRFFYGLEGAFLEFFWMFEGFWGSGVGGRGESLQWHR